jgi:hypothetical protein
MADVIGDRLTAQHHAKKIRLKLSAADLSVTQPAADATLTGGAQRAARLQAAARDSRAPADSHPRSAAYVRVIAAQAGGVEAYVKEQLGYSSIQLTVDTYGHLIPGGESGRSGSVGWRADAAIRIQRCKDAGAGDQPKLFVLSGEPQGIEPTARSMRSNRTLPNSLVKVMKARACNRPWGTPEDILLRLVAQIFPRWNRVQPWFELVRAFKDAA